MEQCLADLSARYPCREEYFTRLYHYFNNPLERYPPSLYIQGPVGTGKTTLLRHFLNKHEIRYAYIDCIEYYTSKMLYEEIINLFTGHQISSANHFENYTKCDTMEDFLEQLNLLSNNRPYIIILKNYERLAGVDKNILPVMVRLSQIIVKLNICCILIGCKPLLTHASMQALPDMMQIHYGQYNKAELAIILQRQQTMLNKCLVRKFIYEVRGIDEVTAEKRMEIISWLGSDFYHGYINSFLSVFYTVCRNVRELLHLSNEHFPTYCRPVIEETIQSTDLLRLWKHMEVPFQRAMNTIYCRMQINTNQPSSFNMEEENATQTLATANRSIAAKNLELPYYTKFLLIAAYLASHNDAKTDKRLFMKYHGKERKRLQSIRAKAKVSETNSTQVGPKAFKIDRMLAIFYAIVEGKVPLTATLMIQIPNLVRLNYLTFISNENCAMEVSAKLKCTVTLDFICQVGKQVNFPVRKYLADFI